MVYILRYAPFLVTWEFLLFSHLAGALRGCAVRGEEVCSFGLRLHSGNGIIILLSQHRGEIFMKKVYLDKTEATMCLGVIVEDAEVILAGATVSSMSVKHKSSEYQRYAEEFDIHFIFDDNLPLLDFYTIPQVDVFATDSDGGVIGSLGRAVDLESEAPICYIDHNQNCFLIANDGKKFLENARQWKTLLVPCTEVEFFNSKEEAKSKYEFLDRDAIEQSLKTAKNSKPCR